MLPYNLKMLHRNSIPTGLLLPLLLSTAYEFRKEIGRNVK